MMAINFRKILNDQKTQISNAPLIIFRLAFGLMMIGSVIRFALNGWIDTMYIQPNYHFSYFGFSWLPYPGESLIYILFACIFLGALGIALGAFYRFSTVLFFLAFTYVELLDKTYYLNHYYFVSLAGFLLILLPAHRRFSVDSFRQKSIASNTCFRYEVSVLRMQVGILYVYAGLAKINTDWLLKAMPLRIWLPANNHLPLIGALLTKKWLAFAFSWAGMLYDVFIPFLLLIKRTRIIGYISVIVFHTLTSILFPIGVFPFVMILSALIFFPSQDQERWLTKIEAAFKMPSSSSAPNKTSSFLISVFAIFTAFQLFFPWRYLAYPDHLFWHEQGYRFSWRVMLMEKVGWTTFLVKNADGAVLEVDNSQFLTPLQEKMMSTQPDMILQYAKMLSDHFAEKDMKDPKVYAESYVTLNGRQSKRYIDPSVDLSKVEDSWANKTWVLSYD